MTLRIIELRQNLAGSHKEWIDHLAQNIKSDYFAVALVTMGQGRDPFEVHQMLTGLSGGGAMDLGKIMLRDYSGLELKREGWDIYPGADLNKQFRIIVI